MAIIAFVSVVVFLGLTTALKSQQLPRLQIAAASRMLQLSQAWAHPDNRFADLCLERGEMAALGTDAEHDLERRLFLQVTPAFGYKEGHYAGWGNVGVVPPAIVARLDSENDEIRRVLAEGGQLYYFRPGSGVAGRHGGEHEGTSSVTGDNQLDSETRKLVFAVRGKPQQNALRNHPALDWPIHESYPGPPQPYHRRTWAWNLDRQSPTQLSSPITGIGRIDVGAGGTGYAQPPRVRIDPPVVGRQARARAIVNLGRVTAVEVTDPGYGYVAGSPPSAVLLPIDGGTGATAQATTVSLSMAMVDYAAADADAAIGAQRWNDRHPYLTWRSPPAAPRIDAETAFNQLYDYCYHFRTPGADPAFDRRTWVEAPHTKLVTHWGMPDTAPFAGAPATRVPPKDRLGYHAGRAIGKDDQRDPVNRFGHAGYWRTQIETSPQAWLNWTGTSAHPGYTQWSGPCPATPAEPFYQRIDLATVNYDNPAVENLATGERGRLHQLLVLAQQLVRMVMEEGAAGGTRMTYEEQDGDADPTLGVHWPLPHAPAPLPPPGATGWSETNEQIFPPPFKIMALSYLAWAAHTATRVSVSGSPVGSADWDQGSGIRRIILDGAGSGYVQAPRVDVSGGGGHGCIAQAIIDTATQTVQRIRILDPGTGYDPAVPPTITLVGPCTGAATAHVDPTDIVRTWPDLASATAEVARLQAYALALNTRCKAWVARYASADPYDWGAPRPANRATAWDFPLLQYDLFPKGGHRPDAAVRAALPYVDGANAAPKPNTADADLLPDLTASHSQYTLFDRTLVPGQPVQSLVERWTVERDRPAWRRGVPYTVGVPSGAAAEDIDRMWKIIAPRQPVNWGPSRALDGYNRDKRISQQVLPPGTAGDVAVGRQAGAAVFPADWDNTANLRYSWGDHARCNLLAPFAAAERMREVVFWAVDWQSYEDFETALEAPYDARKFVQHSDARTANMRTDLNQVDTRFHNPVTASSIGEFDSAGSLSLPAYANPNPVDRNNNGRGYQEDMGTKDMRAYKPDIGQVRATVRMAATQVARFLIYDGRVIGNLRQ